MATIPLKTITFPGLDNTYTVPQVDNTLTIAGKVADAKVTGDKFNELEASEATKANIDGSYDELTSGSSKQLLSTVSIEDSTPYNFRTSGGSIDIGDREVDKLIGGTIAWNQHWSYADIPQDSNIYSGSYTADNVTFTKNNDGSISIQTTAEGANADVTVKIASSGTNKSNIGNVVQNHVHLICGVIGGSESTYCINYASTKNTYANGAVFPKNSSGFNMWIKVFNGAIITTPVKVYPNIIDLTQMFGSTIADYIYSLEQAHEGDGVAFFRKLFPKPYYAYNAGQLMSVKALSHDTTGFNQWDEEWEVGAISGGQPVGSYTNCIRSKNFCECLPNTKYYLKCGEYTNNYYAALHWYDADKKFISVIYTAAIETTSPANARYFKVSTNTSTYLYGNTYNHDICINLSWDGERDGEYEPYEKHSYELDSDLELRGIPKLNSNNELYYDGDVYEADGTVTRRFGVVDLGTLTWSVTSAGYFYSTSINKLAKNGNAQIGYVHIRCVLYVAQNVASLNGLADKSMSIDSGGNIQIHDSAYSDSNAFETAMSGVYLIYELATPTTESADPYTNPQIVNDFGTEEYVDSRDVQIPVGHVTQYQPNLRAKLEMAPNSPDGDGDYIVRQTNGENAYVPLVIPTELPTTPTESGTYVLKVTVSDGTPTLSWVAE